MTPINSLADIMNAVQRLVYQSPTLELDFCPTYEVGKQAWDNIQKDMEEISNTMSPKIPYENTGAWLSFMCNGAKCFIKPIQQPYKNSEVVKPIDSRETN